MSRHGKNALAKPKMIIPPPMTDIEKFREAVLACFNGSLALT